MTKTTKCWQNINDNRIYNQSRKVRIGSVQFPWRKMLAWTKGNLPFCMCTIGASRCSHSNMNACFLFPSVFSQVYPSDSSTLAHDESRQIFPWTANLIASRFFSLTTQRQVIILSPHAFPELWHEAKSIADWLSPPYPWVASHKLDALHSQIKKIIRAPTQPKCISEAMRISSEWAMKGQVLHTLWCNISGEAAGEIWHWSLLGVKGVNI